MNTIDNDFTVDQLESTIELDNLMNTYQFMTTAYDNLGGLIGVIEKHGIQPELEMLVGDELKNIAPSFYTGDVEPTLEALKIDFKALGAKIWMILQQIFDAVTKMMTAMIKHAMDYDKQNNKLLKALGAGKDGITREWKNNAKMVKLPEMGVVFVTDFILEPLEDFLNYFMSELNSLKDYSDPDAFIASIKAHRGYITEDMMESTIDNLTKRIEVETTADALRLDDMLADTRQIKRVLIPIIQKSFVKIKLPRATKGATTGFISSNGTSPIDVINRMVRILTECNNTVYDWQHGINTMLSNIKISDDA